MPVTGGFVDHVTERADRDVDAGFARHVLGHAVARATDGLGPVGAGGAVHAAAAISANVSFTPTHAYRE